mmetsp:Transcript_29158/g.100623  ORF Transcript_29158/g.100623 Transcript_29158/m.100623 type:complete len:229 (+) Transcript_29158:398-1084(+)
MSPLAPGSLSVRVAPSSAPLLSQTTPPGAPWMLKSPPKATRRDFSTAPPPGPGARTVTLRRVGRLSTTQTTTSACEARRSSTDLCRNCCSSKKSPATAQPRSTRPGMMAPVASVRRASAAAARRRAAALSANAAASAPPCEARRALIHWRSMPSSKAPSPDAGAASARPMRAMSECHVWRPSSTVWALPAAPACAVASSSTSARPLVAATNHEFRSTSPCSWPGAQPA